MTDSNTTKTASNTTVTTKSKDTTKAKKPAMTLNEKILKLEEQIRQTEEQLKKKKMRLVKARKNAEKKTAEEKFVELRENYKFVICALNKACDFIGFFLQDKFTEKILKEAIAKNILCHIEKIENQNEKEIIKKGIIASLEDGFKLAQEEKKKKEK